MRMVVVDVELDVELVVDLELVVEDVELLVELLVDDDVVVVLGGAA
jgi:hypothetical protein